MSQEGSEHSLELHPLLSQSGRFITKNSMFSNVEYYYGE